MKQLITRVDESLAEAVKQRPALTGESVNAYVTRLLRSAVEGRQSWKSEAVAAGRLVSRASVPLINPSSATGRESIELDIMIILNLALPERTCYEPLASTHADTQGSAELGRIVYDSDHTGPLGVIP